MADAQRWTPGKPGMIAGVDVNGRLEKAVPTIELSCPNGHQFRVNRLEVTRFTLVVCPTCEKPYLVPSNA